MREFKYDVVELIHAIKDRPCLWDRTIESYKDRVERRLAWNQVFSLLDERYEDMTPEEKRVTSEKIQSKWTNIRDTFVKTLKTKMGKRKHKYILHEHLTFLLKVASLNDDYYMDYSSEDIAMFKTERDNPNEISTDVNIDISLPKKPKKLEYIEEPSRTIDFDKSELDYVEMDECNDPRIMNEDEAFFASLLPTVVKYSEDERLEFRIEVLAVMKKIKDQRK